MDNTVTRKPGTTCVLSGCVDPKCDGLHHTGTAGQRWTESEATYRAALEIRKRNPWY
jgi:hypothetical protein